MHNLSGSRAETLSSRGVRGVREDRGSVHHEEQEGHEGAAGEADSREGFTRSVGRNAKLPRQGRAQVQLGSEDQSSRWLDIRG